MKYRTFAASSFLLASFIIATATQAATVPAREIQFKSIDFASDVIELHNFGDVPVDISGWRLCTHDENETRRYTAAAGLNGQSIAAGESLFIHVNNDASATNTINLSTIGGNFAGPFDTGAFGMSLFFSPVSFGNGNTIADHIQWSLGGVDNTSADERSDEAQNGGVWVNQSQWISTSATTQLIKLTDLTGAELHSPANYTVVPEPTTLVLACFGIATIASRRRQSNRSI